MPVQFEFPQDVQTVFDTLTDPQFLVDRCIALGELDAECDVEQRGEVTVVKLVREIRRDIPRLLQKIFSDTQVTDMTEEWQPHKGGWKGHWVLEVRGQPVTVEADFSLEPTRKGGSCYSVTHRAKARIPLVGGQVEKFILSQTSGGAEDELTYLKNFLD